MSEQVFKFGIIIIILIFGWNASKLFDDLTTKFFKKMKENKKKED